jgi:hypothetical protein
VNHNKLRVSLIVVRVFKFPVASKAVVSLFRIKALFLANILSASSICGFGGLNWQREEKNWYSNQEVEW